MPKDVLHLPAELVLQIFSILPPNDLRTSLNVSLTWRQFVERNILESNAIRSRRRALFKVEFEFAANRLYSSARIRTEKAAATARRICQSPEPNFDASYALSEAVSNLNVDVVEILLSEKGLGVDPNVMCADGLSALETAMPSRYDVFGFINKRHDLFGHIKKQKCVPLGASDLSPEAAARLAIVRLLLAHPDIDPGAPASKPHYAWILYDLPPHLPKPTEVHTTVAHRILHNCQRAEADLLLRAPRLSEAVRQEGLRTYAFLTGVKYGPAQLRMLAANCGLDAAAISDCFADVLVGIASYGFCEPSLYAAQAFCETGLFDVNAEERDGMTVLQHAIAGGALNMVRALLESGGGVDVNRATEAEGSPLRLAATGCKPHIVQYLLAREDIKLDNESAWSCCSLLHETASFLSNGTPAIAAQLVASGAFDVNLRCPKKGGVTALHAAVEANNEALVRAILDTGVADMTIKDDSGQTAVDWALATGNQRMVRLLTEKPNWRTKAIRYLKGIVRPTK